MVTLISIFLPKALLHLSCALPLVWLYYGAITDNIGADPVEYVIHFTGIGAFNILLISLMISPLAKHKKWPFMLKHRRLLGVWAFTYSAFHLVNFIAFELQFDLFLFVDEIIKRPYITIGMFAFMILFSLAVTSFDRIKKIMGKRWQRLHNWVYVAAVLVAIHFYWSVKSEIIEPSLYIVAVVLLLSLRKQRLTRWFKG